MQIFKKNLVTFTETKPKAKSQKNPAFSIKVENKEAALNLLTMLLILFPALSMQGQDEVLGRKYYYGAKDVEIGEYITFGLSNAFDISIASIKPTIGEIIPSIMYNEDYIENKVEEFYKYVNSARERYPQNGIGTVANTMLKADGLITTPVEKKAKKQQQPKPKMIVTADWIYLEDEGIYIDKYHNEPVTVSKTTTYNLGEIKENVIHFI